MRRLERIFTSSHSRASAHACNEASALMVASTRSKQAVSLRGLLVTATLTFPCALCHAVESDSDGTIRLPCPEATASGGVLHPEDVSAEVCYIHLKISSPQ